MIIILTFSDTRTIPSPLAYVKANYKSEKNWLAGDIEGNREVRVDGRDGKAVFYNGFPSMTNVIMR
ncbi:hypothetical protein KSZ_36170 [Dictyobacter formicarum]|uniref:Uncharacterized protein n=1 Tax=Dictyobacter formicarum TaxID=2778368 RepID=A0ABQ3VIW8_9CHLR|nr:hypothetical protein KSZ_36170 [Dictyobacter formicarum]